MLKHVGAKRYVRPRHNLSPCGMMHQHITCCMTMNLPPPLNFIFIV